MNSKHLLPFAVAVLCGAIAFSATGCKTKKANVPNTRQGGDTFGGQDVAGQFSDTDVAMVGSGEAGFDESGRLNADEAKLEPVYFMYDNYQLVPSELAKIDAAAAFLNAHSEAMVVVEGHCDERGTTEYNLSLGEYRAQAVRTYLINAGIAADRVQTASYGEEKPAVEGHDESAWRYNRRAEFAFYRR